MTISEGKPLEKESQIRVLGLESSCDETAAAVVDGAGCILSNVVLSQIEEHKPYGGVVPEIAARAHIDHMDRLIEQAMTEAGCELGDLSAVAATSDIRRALSDSGGAGSGQLPTPWHND